MFLSENVGVLDLAYKPVLVVGSFALFVDYFEPLAVVYCVLFGGSVVVGHLGPVEYLWLLRSQQYFMAGLRTTSEVRCLVDFLTLQISSIALQFGQHLCYFKRLECF